jgi:hypothetical protein
MKQRTLGRFALALGLAILLPALTLGCGGQKEAPADPAAAQAAMDKGAAPGGEKGQSLQAPPAPPP